MDSPIRYFSTNAGIFGTPDLEKENLLASLTDDFILQAMITMKSRA